MAAQSFPEVPANAAPYVDRGPTSAFMVPRTGDVINRLPEQAADKVRSLRQRVADMTALSQSAFAAQEEQHTAKLRHQARIDQLLRPRAAGGFNLEADAPQVVEERIKLDTASVAYNRLNELSELRHAQRSTLQRIERAIEQFCGSLPGGTALASWEGGAPTLKKGEALVDAVENRRRRLRELAADLHRIRSAPYPSSEAKALMREQIEALAERGTPSTLGLIENKSPVEFATIQVRSRVLNGDPALVAFAEVPDTIALLVWLHRDALMKKLDAEIAEQADDGAALNDQQRREQEAVIQSDILAVEREEVALIEMGLAQGISISHRDNVSSIAFLGLQLIDAPEAPPPETSPQWLVEHVGGR